MQQSRGLRQLPTILCAAVTLLGAGARSVAARPHVAILVGVSQWSDLENLSLPATRDPPVALEDFSATGLHLELGVYGRRERGEGSALELGGEFGIFWHGSDVEARARDGLTGETIDISYAANAGHLTASARYRFGGAGASTFYIGAGGGLYILRMKEVIGGDTFELKQNSTAPGGYLTAGVDIGHGDGGGAFRIESKLHLFSFAGDDLGGETVGGPLFTLAGGYVF